MNNTTYQVILSTDGKHTVIVTSDDPNGIKAAGSWAKTTYQNLVDSYGLKYGPKPIQPQETEAVEAEAAPICEVHNVPMTLVQGKKGPFYSCHERVGDGWCKYRPTKA